MTSPGIEYEDLQRLLANPGEATGHRSDGSVGGILVPTGSAASMSPVEVVTDPDAQAALSGAFAALDSVRRPAVVTLFDSMATGVRLVRAGDNYEMWQHLGEQRYARFGFSEQSGVLGGVTAHRIGPQVDVVAPMLTIGHTDASVEKAGTGWSTITQALAFGGSYSRPTTAGATATWTTPADTTRVGIRAVAAPNNGIGTVSIDGDLTAANLLPTAQQLVDDGIAPDTVLVENGGPLNPTDRVIDFYAAATASDPQVYDRLVPIAEGLAPGAHVVVVTMTTAKRTAATDSRIGLGGFLYATQDTTPDTANTTTTPLAVMRSHNVNNTPTTWEHALFILPTGTSTATWVGGSHGYETETALTFTIDGAAVTLADTEDASGDVLIATKTATLYHPELGSGATPVATVTTAYRLDRDGLAVNITLDWAVETSVQRAYLGMLDVDGTRGPGMSHAFTEYSTPRLGADQTLSANDNGIYHKVRDDTAYLWDARGRGAVLVHFPDVASAMGNWDHSLGSAALQGFLCVEDRAPAQLGTHKVYPTRVADGRPATAAPGDRWEATVLYRLGWFTAGADTVLAR